jgi:large subunit ribosomal protein L33
MAKAKKGAVELIALQCGGCKNKNYTTQKNRRNTLGKLEFSKFCKFCRKHVEHKEAKIK